MKMIKAIIKPFKLGDVKDALLCLGVRGMTVTEVRGVGAQQGQVKALRVEEYQPSFFSKMKLEVVVTDNLADQVVYIVRERGRTGKFGDGKIFVNEIQDVVRIRTGEHGEAAI